MCTVIKSCDEEHQHLPEKFCSWCLEDKTYIKKDGYEMWHYDMNGNRICRRCYLYMLHKERVLGISRVKIYDKVREETRHIFKWLDMKAHS